MDITAKRTVTYTLGVRHRRQGARHLHLAQQPACVPAIRAADAAELHLTQAAGGRVRQVQAGAQAVGLDLQGHGQPGERLFAMAGWLQPFAGFPQTGQQAQMGGIFQPVLADRQHLFRAGQGHVLAVRDDMSHAQLSRQSIPGFADTAAIDAPLMPSADRVLWRSEELTSNWTLSGLPVFHANVTAEGQRASLILTLAEELPNGALRSFNFAAMSLNHVKDLARGDTNVAGERQEVDVRFFPQMDVVHEGSRIVLIASGNTVGNPGPSLQPVSDGGFINIDMDGAWLDLPVDHDLVVETPQPYVNA